MSEEFRKREETLTRLYHQTAERYWAERQRSHDLIDAQGKAFLASVDYPVDEFLDFVEDICGLTEDGRAFKLKEALGGSMNAQSNLGYAYLNGLGVERDYEQALRFYRMAAERGAASSQCALGYMYAIGLGTAQDFSQSAHWYEKAAENGVEYAQFWLARQYLDGQGVAQDRAKAAHWFAKSAAQGNAEAREELRKVEGAV